MGLMEASLAKVSMRVSVAKMVHDSDGKTKKDNNNEDADACQ